MPGDKDMYSMILIYIKLLQAKIFILLKTVLECRLMFVP